MIGCLRTRVRKQPIIAFYFEFENELKFYNLEAWSRGYKTFFMLNSTKHEIYQANKCESTQLLALQHLLAWKIQHLRAWKPETVLFLAFYFQEQLKYIIIICKPVHEILVARVFTHRSFTQGRDVDDDSGRNEGI